MDKKYCKVKFLEKFDLWEEKEIAKMSRSDAEELESAGIIEIIKEVEEKETKTQKRIKEIRNEDNLKKSVISEKEVREILERNYHLIQKIIKKYSDINEEYLPIISSWVVGTYMHHEFESYPYLFINAMRGSGKTRLLKLIAFLSNNGEITNNVSESVLFRTGKNRTLCIDEFEGVGKKEYSTLREILNSAYKRGAKVKRMKKKKTMEGEEYVVEEFDVYFPISMANIWGMEEVLGDRCITVFLEKSNQQKITKLIENFDNNPEIMEVKNNFSLIQCSLCSVVVLKNIYNMWNNYILDKYDTTLNTYNTNNTYNYTNYIHFFNKVDEKNIDGRNFELSFPLLILANTIGNEEFDVLLENLSKIISEKRDDEYSESKDVSLIDFVSQYQKTGFIQVKQLSNEFMNYLGDEQENKEWLNSKWVGNALKRLKLVIEKKRVSKGIEVRLNIEKAKERINMFK